MLRSRGFFGHLTENIMKVVDTVPRSADQATALRYLEKVRWNGRPVCPYCESDKVCVHASKDKKLPRWQCQNCHRPFSATVGTTFERTHLPLQTWFSALAIMFKDMNNAPDAQLARELGLPYKTARRLASRIREAMLTDPGQKRLLQCIVESDRKYSRGKALELVSDSASDRSGKEIQSQHTRHSRKGTPAPSRGLVLKPDTLRKLRRTRGWTQEDLAENAGVGDDMIQRAEKGTRISLGGALAIAKALEVALSILMESSGPPRIVVLPFGNIGTTRA
jgi:transposase-like protein/DNA-binding XRE family transcriptional regulator